MMVFIFSVLISFTDSAALFDNVILNSTFFILVGIYFIVMTASAQYLAPPPEGWVPKGFEEAKENGTSKIKEDLSQLTANEAIKTRRFWLLWFMLFINITCGIAILARSEERRVGKGGSAGRSGCGAVQ